MPAHFRQVRSLLRLEKGRWRQVSQQHMSPAASKEGNQEAGGVAQVKQPLLGANSALFTQPRAGPLAWPSCGLLRHNSESDSCLLNETRSIYRAHVPT